ncbi:hypothetical protein AN191_13795 [Loktanella sp. 5RATIMAR09]|uniref:hypothetical protein n=1 Tax=Loktanella sp. 5RATIMAR09 TaxID=1225655 RepID=UPI0006EBDC59|nr:hypothetical protein [Loktanella sp. 5RATIMAR09]KQI71346.1 hypothetical protein AN191_13795 [Loktanella sp. 5RATIMAR09]
MDKGLYGPANDADSVFWPALVCRRPETRNYSDRWAQGSQMAKQERTETSIDRIIKNEAKWLDGARLGDNIGTARIYVQHAFRNLEHVQNHK